MKEIAVLLFSVLMGVLLAEWTERQHARKEKRNLMGLKQELGTAIKQQMSDRRPQPVVGFQITTIKGWLEAVQFLFELVSKDSVELVDGISIKLGPLGNLDYQRTRSSIVVGLQPGIQLIFDAKIARIKPIATGLVIERNKIQLLLDGFPDISIGLD